MADKNIGENFFRTLAGEARKTLMWGYTPEETMAEVSRRLRVPPVPLKERLKKPPLVGVTKWLWRPQEKLAEYKERPLASAASDLMDVLIAQGVWRTGVGVVKGRALNDLMRTAEQREISRGVNPITARQDTMRVKNVVLTRGDLRGTKLSTIRALKESVAKGIRPTPERIAPPRPEAIPPTRLPAVRPTVPVRPPARPPVVPPTVPPEAPPIAPIEPQDPVQKVTSALKEAKTVRKQQEALYTATRAERIAKAKAVGEKVTGEKGFYAELSQLKGKLPRAEFETIRSKISQPDIDNLFDMVKGSSLLNEWQKITTRTGLAKLFGEYGGVVPTEGELTLLKRVFGEDFVKTVKEKRGLWAKARRVGLELANIPRSIMASFDLSAPLRQGVFFIGRPKQFWSAFGKMFKPFVSEKAFTNIQEEIVRRPTFELMNESGLALTSLEEGLTQREEPFMSSWAEKIPGVGPVVRASGRAYVGFLNKLRADVFDDLLKKSATLGLEPVKNPDLTKAIARLVNVGTGRGTMGGLERAAVGLNAFFFSPRLIASRLTLLNPGYYISQPPFVRKEALKSLFTFAGLGMTILGLAKLAGAKVGADPRSSDFGKIRIGNTRIDLWGGFQPYIRMAAQLITGEYVSSTTGKVVTLGEGYKPLTRLDILQRQVESKFSPAFSFATNLLKGQTYVGQPLDVKKELGMRFVPMVIQDAYDILEEDPSLLPAAGLAIFGVGVQTYKKLTPLEQWRKKKISKSPLIEWRKKRRLEKK